MFRFFTQRFSNDLAIDLGTANTLIYLKDKDIVLNEPSVVAMTNTHSGKPAMRAIGHEAKDMLGKTPEGIRAVRPMRDGVIADLDTTEKMLREFIRKALPGRIKAAPRIVIGVPCGATQVEQKAIRDAAFAAGASEVELIAEPMAAAIGAGLPITTPRGSMIVDIGGGTTEIAVISLSGLVYSHSLRVAGDAFNESIINFVRRKYGMLIGEITAENLKETIGCAYPHDDVKEMRVTGRYLTEGVPKAFTVNSQDILEALEIPLRQIVQAIKIAIEQIPPELGEDIAAQGLVLTGGGALLRDLPKLLAEKTGLIITVADNPLTCVVRGAGMALDMLDDEENDSVFIPE
ncbi:MAG: rod shape-determining protein [Neisseriaceae bacterium]|nr:rod shape-determining protein [Neisseriaceae bacterium]MBQ5429103.1 rod shape-determining protein [Neisseriaceae bacterium]